VKPVQNPFSLYDFLGYLVPGVLLVVGLIGVANLHQLTTDIRGFLSSVFAGMSVEVYLPVLVVCYLVGHLVSYISSMTVERYSVWTVGYPSTYLLNRPHKSYLYSADTGVIRLITIGKRLLTAAALAPIVIWDLLLGCLLRFRSQQTKLLDEKLIRVIESVIRPVVIAVNGETDCDEKYDYFRIVYHYALEKCPAHVVKMQNYVALYGFTRTTCLIFIVLGWSVAWLTVANHFAFPWICAFAGVSLLAYVLYLDFNKFYRKFTLEVFMAVSATSQR
jgi:hypothetical protein